MDSPTDSKVFLSVKQQNRIIAYFSLFNSLFKFRVIGLLIFAAAVSMLLAGPFQADKFFLLLLSGGLASAGSACLNNYWDRDIDALMKRTKNRPLPSRHISSPTALAIGIFLLALATALSLTFFNLWTTFFILLGAFIYVVVYTIGLKRRHYLNIVIGGLSGSTSVLAGWSAVSSPFAFWPFFLAALIFLWTPSHFWSLALFYRQDYQNARVPMLSAIVEEKKAAQWITLSSALLLLFSLLPFFLKYAGWLYLLGAISGGTIFLWSGIRLVKSPLPSYAKTSFKLSGVYLSWMLLLLLLLN